MKKVNMVDVQHLASFGNLSVLGFSSANSPPEVVLVSAVSLGKWDCET